MNLLVLLLVLLPVSLSQLGIDAYYAVMAEEADDYDYKGEVRRIAVEPFKGDEQQIAAAEAAWRDLDEAARLHNELLDRFRDPESDEGWYDTYYRHYAICDYDEYLADIRRIYADEGINRIDEEVRRLDRQRDWAHQVIDALPEIGIIERLNRVADADRSIMPLEGEFIAVASGSEFRSLFRCLDAAKQRARQTGDWDSYIEYHRLSLALARHWKQQPESLSWLQAVAVYAGTIDDPSELLARGALPVHVIRELRRVEQEQAAEDAIDHVIAGYRAKTLDAMDAFYYEGGVAIVHDSGSYWNLLSLLLPRRSTTERVVNQYYEEFDVYADFSTVERLRGEKPWAWSYVRPQTSVGVILQMPTYAVMQTAFVTPRFVEVTESQDMECLSLQAIMAIELYKAEQGALPAGLADLVPAYLDELPLDPFDPEGGLLRYRLLEVPDEHGRTYILYSVGRDMTDNGGQLAKDGWPKQALQDRYPGTDYVMNYLKLPIESE